MIQVTMLGRLGKDPETTEKGWRFTMACDLPKKDGEKQTQWVTVMGGGKGTQTFVMEHLRKASQVVVCGRLADAKVYKDKVDMAVFADSVQACGPKPEGTPQKPSKPSDDDNPF